MSAKKNSFYQDKSLSKPKNNVSLSKNNQTTTSSKNVNYPTATSTKSINYPGTPKVKSLLKRLNQNSFFLPRSKQI